MIFYSCDSSDTGGSTRLKSHCSTPLSWTKPGVCLRGGLASPPNICSCRRTPTGLQDSTWLQGSTHEWQSIPVALLKYQTVCIFDWSDAKILLFYISVDALSVMWNPQTCFFLVATLDHQSSIVLPPFEHLSLLLCPPLTLFLLDTAYFLTVVGFCLNHHSLTKWKDDPKFGNSILVWNKESCCCILHQHLYSIFF